MKNKDVPSKERSSLTQLSLILAEIIIGLRWLISGRMVAYTTSRGFFNALF
jgi:hypothetical protein